MNNVLSSKEEFEIDFVADYFKMNQKLENSAKGTICKIDSVYFISSQKIDKLITKSKSLFIDKKDKEIDYILVDNTSLFDKTKMNSLFSNQINSAINSIDTIFALGIKNGLNGFVLKQSDSMFDSVVCWFDENTSLLNQVELFYVKDPNVPLGIDKSVITYSYRFSIIPEFRILMDENTYFSKSKDKFVLTPKFSSYKFEIPSPDADY
jgi:hypothetical protein